MMCFDFKPSPSTREWFSEILKRYNNATNIRSAEVPEREKRERVKQNLYLSHDYHVILY